MALPMTGHCLSHFVDNDPRCVASPARVEELKVMLSLVRCQLIYISPIYHKIPTSI